jgi:hypothetical protein
VRTEESTTSSVEGLEESTTSTRALWAMAPRMHLLSMCCATCESTAESGSSKIYSAALE